MYVRICLCAFLSLLTVERSKSDCEVLMQGQQQKEKDLMKRLEPLKGKVFTIEDHSKQDNKTYVYNIGICISVNNDYPFAGAVQSVKHDSSEVHILGMINATEILGGDAWISLQYHQGHNYTEMCSRLPRVTNIMIICDEMAKTEELSFIEERKEKERELCYYLFELTTKAICLEKKNELSVGSVFCIIFFSTLGIYLLLGFLYRRVVVGAKGLEQIPNYSFWQDFGNLQADGCDFICRCGSRQQTQAYRGIDDCLDREEEERDDQLLTM